MGKKSKSLNIPAERQASFCVENTHLNEVGDEKICQYFRPNSKYRDVHKVQHNFHVDDIQLILQTRIPINNTIDRVAWTGSSKGEYTVKLGNQYWTSLTDDNVNVRSYKVGVSYRIYNYLTKLELLCGDSVIIKIYVNKGVETPIICPMCNVDIEHIRHLFFKCKYAVDFWQLSGLIVDLQAVESTPCWLLETISEGTMEL